ncbi:ChaN family lipoprotein [Microbispora hainanensis]|uniref:ChaN family lipoprotein n=1 Tax=Microbispora hainanensis TaxID=568844 RepID=A0A544YMV7_9ACTN|nr:ChaN family lipoprotein [Microbispora hainanensis]TQS18084.1 ChaN family lipoprotein [Microbispora hainanensis]
MEDPQLTRRRFLAVTGASAAAGGLLTTSSTASTDAATPDLTRAVLAAFKRHQLVAIGESHGQQEHGDAQQMLLADPRLPQVVDDIVVEFGNALHQPTMDRFVAGGAVDDPVLRQVWRNTTQSPGATGDQPIREQFFRTVRAVNWTLPPERRIRVLLGDPPIDWSRITTQDQVDDFLDQRDAHMASVVEREVLAKGRRALICYGSGHVMHSPAPGQNADHGVPLIEEQTGQHVYVIVAGSHPRLTTCPRRTVIPCRGTWLESTDAGEFMDAPRLCGVPLGKLADAVLYLGQPTDLTQSLWNPAIFLDPEYWAELQRRNALSGNVIDLEQYRQEQPITWPAPSPVSCATDQGQ